MSGNPQDNQQQAVLCDMCIEDRKPARKTCMKCEISMCVQHLQAHLTTPVLLQTHPLTEPMAAGAAGLSGTKCPQHGKVLEYYCLDDLTCVCVSCAIEDQHRLHNMKTFSTAHKELMEKLNTEQQALEKTDDENVSLEKWEKAEREKLGPSSVRLIEAVNSLRDISLTSVQSSVSARMVSIKTSKSSIQAAKKEIDTFRFLQMYSQVHQDLEKAKAVDLRKGLEPGEDRDKLVQELRQGGEKMVEQAVELWGSLLTLVNPENHHEAFTTSSDLTFDPQTLGAAMLLSEDHKKVFYSRWFGQLSPRTLQIQGVEPDSDVQRWMVILSDEFDWTIGLCDKEYVNKLKNGHVYGLCCQGNQLSSLTTDCEMPDTDGVDSEKKVTVFSECITFPGKNGAEEMPRPQEVEVLWNFAVSSLSFFSRIGYHQRTEILTIKLSLNSQDLFPFVKFEQGTAQNPGFTQQQQWKCSCGKMYTNQVHNYTDGRYQYSKFPQTACSCGGIIGGPCITKLLCELL